MFQAWSGKHENSEFIDGVTTNPRSSGFSNATVDYRRIILLLACEIVVDPDHTITGVERKLKPPEPREPLRLLDGRHHGFV